MPQAEGSGERRVGELIGTQRESVALAQAGPPTIPMGIEVRRATVADIGTVSSILFEAANWLDERGLSMWRADELIPEGIATDVGSGLFFLAEHSGQPAGTMKFQLADSVVWPDVPEHESVFIHRLAVRRQFAGGDVSTALLQWAVEQAVSLGRRHLRLDCEASRPSLRAVYERFGFQHHSDRQVGPHLLARYEFELPDRSLGPTRP